MYKSFEEKFLSSFVSESLKANLVLKDDNKFLSYPRDIIQDLEDIYGPSIEDYDIDGEKVTIWFNQNISKDKVAKIVNRIKSGK